MNAITLFLQRAFIVMLALSFPLTVLADTVTVTTIDDVVDGDVSSIANLIATPGADGEISLREAISAANNTAGADEILFAASTNGTPIELDIGTSNEDANADGDLDITDANGLTITGNGANNTIIDGNGTERVLHVDEGDLLLTGVTIRNGDETASDDRAGGIYVRAGNLTIDQCIVTDNTARFGAGVYFRGTNGIATFTNSTFSGNVAFGGSGGAFRVIPTDGALFMDNCISSGNFATRGAGVDFDATDGTATISNSVISGNTATSTDGAGVLHSATDGIMTIRDCEISNNTAAIDGGGVSMNSTDGTLTITNSTISNNRANRHGGGISHDAFGGVVNLNFVTITQNIADDNADSDGEGGGIDITGNSGTATVNIHNSIVQGNDDESPAQTSADDSGNSGSIGAYVSQGGNVFGSGTGCPVDVDDTTDSANLGPLQDNGGSTKTHALMVGSAAVNFAECDTVTIDQRGEQRNDGFCDSGAFEASGLNCFTVTNTNDDGDGSLRQAILDANAIANLNASTPDTIKFDIAGAGPHTISPLTELPFITDAVVIDGYTQPGAAPATATTDATIMIVLDGETSSLVVGLVLDAGSDGSVIKGLAVGGFTTFGPIPPIAIGVGSSSNIIAGNFIGTDAAGTSAFGNTIGVLIGGPGVSANTIGGTTPAARNIISGNAAGVAMQNETTGNKVQGNYIGTDITGTNPLGNGVFGVGIADGVSAIQIGGADAGEGNIIAYNDTTGVFLGSTAGAGNAILGNAIFNNGELGIDHDATEAFGDGDGVTPNDAGDGDTGPNNLQNFPVITEATTDGSGSLTISGTLNSTPNTNDFRIEFFANTVCNGNVNGEPDAVDYGEGETFLGFTTISTDGSGDATFSVNLSADVAVGEFITATATATDNSTSEFSQCAAVTAEAPELTIINDLIQAKSKNVKWLSATNQLSFDIAFKNISGTSISDIQARIDELNPAPPTITVNNADNSETGLGAIFDYSDELGSDDVLSPSETSGYKTWIFDDPSAVNFTFFANILGNIDGQPIAIREDNVSQLSKTGDKGIGFYANPAGGKAGLLEDFDELASELLPQEFSLEQNYPNPFNPETRIRYSLPEAASVKLIVYNMLGQEIKSLVNEDKQAGSYDIIWNGRDNFGQPVASGIYIYRITAGEFSQVRKLTLVR